jgi:hypothetical protein
MADFAAHEFIVANGAIAGELLRGLTATGIEVWRFPLTPNLTPAGQVLAQGYPPIADNSGGMLALASNTDANNRNNGFSSLLHIDGTGAIAWRYDSALDETIDPGYVQRPDGQVFAVETLPKPGGGGANSYLGQFDGQAGTLVQRVPLPLGHLHIDSDPPEDFDLAPNPGPISALPDGSVAAELSTLQQSTVSGVETTTTTLYVAVLRPDGTFSTTQLAASTCVLPCTSSAFTPQPEQVLPDGQGGMLIMWNKAAGGSGTTQVTHADASGSPLATYNLPIQSGSGSPIDNMVLSENGQAWVSNGFQTASFDVASGAVLANVPVPIGHNYQLGPALWGGGIAITDLDRTVAPEIQNAARLDASGNVTSDGFDPTGLVPNTTWPTLGVWAGNPNGNYTQVAQSEIVPADSVWGFPGGNPSGNRQPTTLLMESVPFWGAVTSANDLGFGCRNPIVINGRTLPAAEPVTDSNVKENVKLLSKLQTLLNQVVNQNTINSSSCSKFFNDSKGDPLRAQVYPHLLNAVQNQQWWNGHLSIISNWSAGMYEDNTPADQLKILQAVTVCGFEITPPTELQLEDGQPHPWLGALSELQPPARNVYYNGAALDYLIPSTLVHESMHNLTRKLDNHLRTILGMKTPEDPLSTDDISLKLESEGCAPGR